ncbi:hypothetical protein [Streptomyces yangpuensis]|uniref:hypothetical protein n=1 Tax=Streptomyces yangpuensis TaxID=1648182 RepID=UPI00365E6969
MRVEAQGNLLFVRLVLTTLEQQHEATAVPTLGNTSLDEVAVRVDLCTGRACDEPKSHT